MPTNKHHRTQNAPVNLRDKTMSTKAIEIQHLIRMLEITTEDARIAICVESNCVISPESMETILNGEGRNCDTALALYALKNIYEKRIAEAKPPLEDREEDFLGCIEHEYRGEYNVKMYVVKASSPEEAITKLASWGINVHGNRNDTDYDCTGQWCANQANPNLVERIKCLDAYGVPMHWVLDV